MLTFTNSVVVSHGALPAIMVNKNMFLNSAQPFVHNLTVLLDERFIGGRVGDH